MQYKCVVVTAKDACASSTFINDEVEQTCNSMASQGYVLVNFWESQVQACGGKKHAICLIFVRP
jgi:hypothetical protein